MSNETVTTEDRVAVLEQKAVALESSDRLARLRLWIGLAKFLTGTVALTVLTAILNHQIQARTLSMKETEQQQELSMKETDQQQEYVKQFVTQALDDNLEKRVRFAHYFGSLLGKNWHVYYLGIQADLAAQRAELAEARAAALRLETQPKTDQRGAAELDALRLRIGELESNVTPSFTLSTKAREETFGQLPFTSAPQTGNPEAIKIDDAWIKENLEQVTIPQLQGIPGAPASGTVWINKKATKSLLALWEAWEKRDLLKYVLSWNGGFVPRLIRGSRSIANPHAFGGAFDINAAWNGLGAEPAKVGERGSVRELVPLAAEFGFAWGGTSPRPDGMHFEFVAKP